MNWLKYSLMLTSLILNLGCHSTGGANPNGTSPNADAPDGVFSTQKDLPTGDTSRFLNGCKAPASIEPLPQVDPRVKPAMSFTETRSVFTKTGINDSETVQTTVVSATAVTLQSRLTYLNVIGFAGVTQGFTSMLACTFQTGGLFNCTTNPPIPSVNDGGDPYSACTVGAATSETHKLHYGSFKIVSSSNVHAYELVDDYEGELICQNQDKGPIHEEDFAIFSNDVPSLNSTSFCGGVPIFNSRLLSDRAGNTVSLTKYEVKTFKAR